VQFQNDYFAAYRSLKLTRDSEGVLVAESHSDDGPFTFDFEGLTVQLHLVPMGVCSC